MEAIDAFLTEVLICICAGILAGVTFLGAVSGLVILRAYLTEGIDGLKELRRDLKYYLDDELWGYTLIMINLIVIICSGCLISTNAISYAGWFILIWAIYSLITTVTSKDVPSPKVLLINAPLLICIFGLYVADVMLGWF